MAHHPFETVIIPGYIVDLQYKDDFPPEQILSSQYDYYKGYFEALITVTRDNLSVAEQIRKVFLVAPTNGLEEHGTLKTTDYVVIPISWDQRITHLVFGCKTLDIGEGPTDFDTIFFMLSDSEEDAYGSAWLLLKHDKEDILLSHAG